MSDMQPTSGTLALGWAAFDIPVQDVPSVSRAALLTGATDESRPLSKQVALLKRIFTVLSVTVIMAALLVAGAVPAFAKAFTPEFGGPSHSNVTDQAYDNCEENFQKQTQKGVTAGGGPKAGGEGDEGSPTNCDHFFQREGIIGKNK